MKISQAITYAVQAAVALAHATPNVPIPCSKLAATGEMPERFLLQVLRSLVTHQVLRSAKGAYGGYYLARPPNEITLLEIIDVFDNLEATLPQTPGLTEVARDRLRSSVAEIAALARWQLQKLTLADLVESPSEHN